MLSEGINLKSNYLFMEMIEGNNFGEVANKVAQWLREEQKGDTHIYDIKFQRDNTKALAFIMFGGPKSE